MDRKRVNRKETPQTALPRSTDMTEAAHVCVCRHTCVCVCVLHLALD